MAPEATEAKQLVASLLREHTGFGWIRLNSQKESEVGSVLVSLAEKYTQILSTVASTPDAAENSSMRYIYPSSMKFLLPSIFYIFTTASTALP
jgi:hypothetical protein